MVSVAPLVAGRKVNLSIPPPDLVVEVEAEVNFRQWIKSQS